ncbi:hypothetical protein U1701_18430 [Sphingomonas sp. PB2P19]|uniref:hypothetical protein n=1 Tax=Sphingomonas rhamnosi TaxID=3096156 RepID=UPI002FC61726
MKKIVRVGASIIAAFLISSAISFGFAQYRKKTANFDDMLNEVQLTQPSLANMFITMRREFPAQYEDFASAMTRDMRAGVDRQQVRQNSSNLMRQFAAKHVQELGQAPSSDLQMYNYQQLKLARTLASVSPKLCAHFVMTGLQPTDIPPQTVLDQLGETVTAQLTGIAAGRRAPAGRDLKDLPEADALAMVSSMKAKGVSDAEIRIFAAPAELARSSETLQCKLGIAMLEGVSSLPLEQSARITAFLVTHA